MKQLFCRNTAEWHKWLLENHLNETSVWLVFYKNQSKPQQLNYNSALDEALCFGWIDSIIKRIDDTKYVRKFSKRRLNSNWSDINKRKIEMLINENRMTAAGYAVVKAAKENGSWNKPARQEIQKEISEVLQNALERNNKAKAFFESLSPSQRTRYIRWIANAKKKETIDKRVKESIDLLARNMHLGLK